MAEAKKKRRGVKLLLLSLSILLVVLGAAGTIIFFYVRDLTETSASPPKEIYDSYNVASTHYSESAVYSLANKQGDEELIVLYLHGGSYKYTFTNAHWRFLAYLIDNLNCRVIAPDYPLTPLYDYTDVFEVIVPLYRDIMAEYPPEKVVLMGDSAGGGMALALAEHMKLLGDAPQPAKLVLLSPWLDVSMTNPEIDDVEKKDFFLNRKKLTRAGKSYGGEAGTKHYQVSPIYGELSGLPEIVLFTGTNDMLNPDAAKFRDLCGQAGAALDYREYPGMFHVWMLTEGLPIEDIDRAKAEIVEVLEQIKGGDAERVPSLQYAERIYLPFRII